MSTDKENKGGCYLKSTFYVFLLVIIVKKFWPEVIPFSFLHFWKINGSLVEAVKSAWMIFAWGAGFTALVSIITRNNREDNRDAEAHMLKGLCISIWAGVVEEICFRWLLFYGAIIAVKISNFLFFGWLGFGLAECLYQYVVGPVANFITFGYLDHILFNGFGWAVGAAVISSNGKFRDGHAYLGWIGYVNSWFIGMFFFLVMFHYGLPAAILVHFLYDLFIFVVRYLDMLIERMLGWG